MRLTRLNVARSIVVASLAVYFLIGFSQQGVTPRSAVTLAAPAVTPPQGDPAVVGQWSAPFSWPVVAIHTHVLPNGKVLAWQRLDSQLSTQTYLWDPATGSFTQIFNPTTHLFCSGHAFLPDGRLLVSGGHHFSDGHGEPHTNIFDYNTNTWTRVSDMNAGRWYPTNTTLGTGEVLTVSGTFFNGSQVVNNTLPQVWQTTGGWRSLTGAQLGLQLYPWMLLAPNGRVFNSGPDRFTRFLDTNGAGAWIGGPASNFGYRDYGSSVMYDDGKVLITGGGPPTNTTEVIDLNAAAPAWRFVGSMAFTRRQMNATILADGKVLATGGTSGGGFNNAFGSVLAAEIWDPATESWSTMASMQIRRLYHSTAVLLPDGRVLSAGGGMPAGEGGIDTDHPDAEIYSPPYLFRGARPTITSAPTTVNYGETFTVKTPDFNSITKVTWIRLSSVTHAFNENQRINYLSFTKVVKGGLFITAPSNRNVCPPGHYMLFILNSNGVPSVARIIRIQEPAPVSTASAIITTDNFYDMYFNGTYRGSGANWQQSETYSLPVQAGKNVIAIKANDAGGVAGLLAELQIAGQRTGSNFTWKVSLTAPVNWADVNFDDSGWANATDYGPYGIGPWGTNVNGMPVDTPGRWIWSSNNDLHDQVYIRASFDSVDATAIVTCDNFYDLYFNGLYKGSGANWQQAQTYGLSTQLGKNVLAIKCNDAGGVAGLLAELQVAGQRLGSNFTWKVSLTAPVNWADVNFDDSGWANATDYGGYGVGPWGFLVSGMPGDTPGRWIWSSNNDLHDQVYVRASFTR